MMEHSVLDDDFSAPCPTIIKVVGCGGGGSNAVNRMIETEIKSVEFIALNTDLQALKRSIAPKRLPIGQKLTQGLGAGGDPAIGEKAAEEDKELIKQALEGANMVFVTAGMGGGTGTGSAPVVARIAKEMGALTVGIVTTPFSWEGDMKMELAKNGIRKLREAVDSIIVLPNEKITKVYGNGMSFIAQYKEADEQLRQSIEGMTMIITEYGTPNIDFADVRSAMQGQGTALFGIGVATGENKAVDAATKAINNPMLEDISIDGARNFLIFVRAGSDFSLNDFNEITKIVCASASPNYKLKHGIVQNEDDEGKITVTVIATGFNNNKLYDIDTDPEPSRQTVAAPDENVVGLDEFEDILHPATPKASVYVQRQEITEVQDGFFETRKPNAVQPAAPVQTGTSFEHHGYQAPQPVPKNIEPEAGSLGRALGVQTRNEQRGGLTPPEGFRGGNDINQPACWRNGLSRDINLRK